MNSSQFFSFLIGMLAGTTLIVGITLAKGQEWHSTITKHSQCAQYNAATGKFEWLGNKGN